MEPKSLELHRQASSITSEDMIALFRGQVLAIRVPEFCPAEVCQVMSGRLVRHPKLAYYPHAPAIGKVMDAFYEGHSNTEKRKKYYDEVVQSAVEFRQLSWPYLNPMDHLRLILEDMWPAGANRENIHGRPMAFGLAQLFKEGACAWPHQDFLRMDEPDNHRAQMLITQVTALVYIQPADAGGHLQLWPDHYNHEEFMARKNTDIYGLNYKKIPPPSVDIMPQVGELVMADSTKVHAVTAVEAGLRIAVNCFLGFRGIHEPLTYWS
ncbi:MAG: 2OG-Fe(II) oxygenase [Candidatus Zambryskibacteria bacterium]|nr:2OG-Fe(II) oxygenase [Candidatus Zambryskibacteria bacterium]